MANYNTKTREIGVEQLESVSGGEVSEYRKKYIRLLSTFAKNSLCMPCDAVIAGNNLTAEEKEYIKSIWDIIPKPEEPFPEGW